MELLMPNNYQIDYPQMQDVSGLTPVFQNISAQQALHNQLMQQQNQQNQDAVNIGQSYGKSMGGLNPLAMASMLRGGAGNFAIPDANIDQMSGVAGMGNSIGTGLTQNSFNSGVGFNPYAQSGGYGLKY